MRANTENKSMDMEVRDINYILPHYIAQYLYESKNEDPDKIIFPMFLSVPHPRKPGVLIPIEYIPITDPAAVEIAEDGKDIPEVTPEQEAALDTQDKAAKELKEQVESQQTPEQTEDAIAEEIGIKGCRCSRCGLNFIKTEEIDSDICGTCADDLRQEDVAAKMAKEAEVKEPKEPKDSVSPAKASMKQIAEDRRSKMPEDLGSGHADGLGSRDARLDKKIASDLKEEPAVEEDKEIPAEIEKLPEK